MEIVRRGKHDLRKWNHSKIKWYFIIKKTGFVLVIDQIVFYSGRDLNTET